MQKKIGDIIEAFENYRFEDALRQIDQLKKKLEKDNKKKNALSQKDDRIIHIIKCGSLASTGKVHEANQLFNTYFTDKVISDIPSEHAFLLISIAELVYDSKILQHIQLINKTVKQDIHLERFMLSRRMFSSVSKTFLKEFISGKKLQDGLAQIFLEYLNQINKNHPIQQDYSRDLKIVPIKQLNLKMVQLFFMKYLSGINIPELQNKKLRSSIIDLKIRLAINTNKQQQAKKIYLQYFDLIQDHFVYLRSIRDMPQNKVENQRFYIQNCGRIFRRNLQIQKYVPMYDYYNEFLDFVLSSTIKQQSQSYQQLISAKKNLSTEQLYDFSQISNKQILIYYYHSLQTQLFALTQGETHQKAKKSDYYKISIKGLLLQLLRIIYEVYKRTNSQQKLQSHELFNEFLQIYYIQFSKTLTYVNQMQTYLPNLKKMFQKLPESQLPSVFSKKDDNLIVLINKVKILSILNQEKFNSIQEVQKWVGLCWNYYKKFILEVEQSKKRQKGEVYLSDQFVTTLCDIVIFFIENHLFAQKNSSSIRESLLSKLMAILDYTTQLSPFNAYLKLRLIYICQKLNYFDKLLDTFFSMDIKSVQFQTLGYYMINTLMNFNLYGQYESNLSKMVRSYYENQKQTSQYSLKGLKAGATHQVFQYFSYQKTVEKSFSKMLLFYSLYLKHQNQTQSLFFLNWILQKLQEYKKQNKKISFNCDTKTMNNLISSLGIQESYSEHYNEFYGYLNSVTVFEFAAKLRRSEILLKNILTSKTTLDEKMLDNVLSELTQQHNALLKSNFTTLYDLQSQFNLIDEYLGKAQFSKNTKKQTFSQKTIQNDLEFFLKLSELKILFLKLCSLTFNILKQTEKNQQLQNQFDQLNKALLSHLEEINKHFSTNLTWRQQTKNCWCLRQALFSISNLFNLLNEQATKNKKLIKSSKNLISSTSKNLQETILLNVTNLKFNQNIPVSKQILNIQIEKQYIDKVYERNEIMRRFVSMDQKQAKKYLTK